MNGSSQLSITAKKRLRRKQNRLNRNEEINIPEPVIVLSPVKTSKYNSKEKRKLLRKISFSLNSKEENNDNIEEKVNNNLVKEEVLNLDNQNTEINEPIITQIENKTYDEIEEKVYNDNLVKEEVLNLDNQNTEINEPIITQIENKTYDEIEEKVYNDNIVKEEVLNLDNQNTEINEPIITQIENKKIENKTYDEYVTDAVVTAREILKKNYCESKPDTDADNTNLDITDGNKEVPLMEMVINDDFSTITKNDNLTYTRTIWCLHKDCIISLERFNSKEELEKHMIEFHN